MNKRRFFGVSLIALGLAVGLAKPLGITGNVIGLFVIKDVWFYIAGMGMIVGGAGLLMAGYNEHTRIGGVDYEKHALERMEKRVLFPTVVKSVLETGREYPLTHIRDFGEAKGATRAYIGKDIADVISGGGRLGERIKTIRKKGEDRKSQSVIVLTDEDKKIKTTYIADPKSLKWFIDKYTK